MGEGTAGRPRRRTAQPHTASVLAAPAAPALCSDLPSLEAEGDENSLCGRPRGGLGQSDALQLRQGLAAASGLPPSAHISPARGSGGPLGLADCRAPPGPPQHFSGSAPESCTLPPSLASLPEPGLWL